MASKMIFLVTIIAQTTIIVNSMPTKNLADASTSGLEISVAPEAVKISTDQSSPIVRPEVDQLLERGKSEGKSEAAPMERRSVETDDAKATLEGEQQNADLESDKFVDSLENSDDLETAAGTNILRPLFVYRQQLAYRERVRKARRRAVPNAPNA